jgi:predicted N-formylglutamate amidohydrolase
MAGRKADKLLGPDDPVPFEIFNAAGTSPFLLVGDHAGAAVPRALDDLGLTSHDLARHIAVDIGVVELGRHLALQLDAVFVFQLYSRLVIDCNRDPARADAVPEVSDGTPIPGNHGLTRAARSARVVEIHSPYHRVIGELIDERRAAGESTLLLSLHSFTPAMDGLVRPWDVGILHWLGNTGLALAMRDRLADKRDITVGDNVPYAMDDTDYTVPRHAFSHGIAYAEIEVRQNLISNLAGQKSWARRLGDAAREAQAMLNGKGE